MAPTNADDIAAALSEAESLLEELGKKEDATIVLHWNESGRTWDCVKWPAWEKFRALLHDFEPLPGVAPGDHWFVVCIVDEQKTLFNIIPHRYRLDRDRRISGHDFHDLSSDEVAKVSKWQMSHTALDDADQAEFDALRDRIWKSYLPSTEAAMILIRSLPGFPASGAERPVMAFLKAFGISGHNHAVN